MSESRVIATIESKEDSSFRKEKRLLERMAMISDKNIAFRSTTPRFTEQMKFVK